MFCTILAGIRSYPHAHSLDFINDRGCDLHRTGAGLGRRWNVGIERRLTLSAALTSDSHCMTPGRPPARRRTSKRAALLPPYTTGIVRIRSNLDIKLGRVIGGRQWRAADRRYASRCGHSSRGASGVAFVDALCRGIVSRGVDPRSLISSPS